MNLYRISATMLALALVLIPLSQAESIVPCSIEPGTTVFVGCGEYCEERRGVRVLGGLYAIFHTRRDWAPYCYVNKVCRGHFDCTPTAV